MTEDEQKFLALDGVHTWGEAVIRQGRRMEEADRDLLAIEGPDWSRSARNAREEANSRSRAERTLFLDAAEILISYSKWARSLKFLDVSLFQEFDQSAELINLIRGHNVHVVNYFSGGGRRTDAWKVATDEFTADSSSMVGDLIGGRLNYRELSTTIERLLSQLPPRFIRGAP